MSEKLKADNLAKAVRQLPNPKSYPPETVTILVGKIKYTFSKNENEWYFKIESPCKKT
jgi:hypothetical protein